MTTFDKETFKTLVLGAEQAGAIRLPDTLNQPSVLGGLPCKEQSPGEKGARNLSEDGIAKVVLPGMGYRELKKDEYQLILKQGDPKDTHKLLYANTFVRHPNGTQQAPDFYVFSDDGVRTSIEVKSVASKTGGVQFNSGTPQADTLYCFVYPTGCVIEFGLVIFGADYLQKVECVKKEVKQRGDHPEDRDNEWLEICQNGLPTWSVRPMLGTIPMSAPFLIPHILLYKDYK